MSKKKLLFIVSICIASICTIVALSSKYIISNCRLYERKSHELSINLKSHDTGILKKLNQFPNLGNLRIEFADSSDFIDIPILNSSIDLSIACSSLGNAHFLHSIKNIRTMHMFETRIELEEPLTSSVDNLELVSCDVNGFENFTSISNIYKISIYQGSIDNCIANEVLYDSSVFSKFKSVSELEITGIIINDSSGIEKMESLKKLTIDEGALSCNQIKMFEENGVYIFYRD